MSGSIVADPAATSSGAPASNWDAKIRRAILSLALAVFALVFSEFLPAGLLTPLASGLAISSGSAGQAVTATAVGGMVSALLTGLVIGNADRRLVLLVLSSLAVLGNVVCALATDLPVLIVARIGIGIAIGGFWALSTAVVGRLVAAREIGRAMGQIMAGVSLATILAPPAATFVAAHLGWRMAFAAAALMGLIALVAQAMTLPRLTSSQPVRLSTMLEVTRRRPVYVGLLAVIGIAAGHFAGFTYFRLVLQDLGRMSASMTAGVLLIYGLCNFIGTLVGARFVDRRLVLMLSGSAAVIGASALGIAAGVSATAIAAFMCVWGMAFGVAPLALQTWMARRAVDQLESVGAIFISAFQVSIALGAAAGGLIVDRYDVSAVMLFTALLALLATVAPAMAGLRPAGGPQHALQSPAASDKGEGRSDKD
jgi:MFS transporter, DHA1 family, purine ribonucleoside efflux pump